MSIGRRIGLSWTALIGLLVLMGQCDPACGPQTPNLVCDDFSIFVAPGTCVSFANPCDPSGEFSFNSGLRLCEEPEGVFTNRTLGPGGVTWEICADAGVAGLIDEPVDFVYAEPSEGWGEGVVYVSTVEDLVAQATANPTLINIGESSQLDVSVTGGTMPYTYEWQPAATLDDNTVPAPLASPITTTQYTVTVTDAQLNQTTTMVTVSVGAQLVVSVTPDTINPGESSQLLAVATGGTPPWGYSWIPIGSLDDPGIGNPVATPNFTTLYLVSATDQLGTNIQGSVTVTVNMVLAVTASPQQIDIGESSQLDVAVQGGLPPYTYEWQPAEKLDDHTVPNPIASPTATTLYTVTVTDSAAVEVTGQVEVEVGGAGGACFTIMHAPGGPYAGQFIQFDPGCSTGGPFVTYEWWFFYNGDPQSLPDETNTFPVTSITYENPGPKPVRLLVRDAAGNEQTVVQIIDVQPAP